MQKKALVIAAVIALLIAIVQKFYPFMPEAVGDFIGGVGIGLAIGAIFVRLSESGSR